MIHPELEIEYKDESYCFTNVKIDEGSADTRDNPGYDAEIDTYETCHRLVGKVWVEVPESEATEIFGEVTDQLFEAATEAHIDYQEIHDEKRFEEMREMAHEKGL